MRDPASCCLQRRRRQSLPGAAQRWTDPTAGAGRPASAGRPRAVERTMSSPSLKVGLQACLPLQHLCASFSARAEAEFAWPC